MSKTINIILAQQDDRAHSEFIEIEDIQGKSIRVGKYLSDSEVSLPGLYQTLQIAAEDLLDEGEFICNSKDIQEVLRDMFALEKEFGEQSLPDGNSLRWGRKVLRQKRSDIVRADPLAVQKSWTTELLDNVLVVFACAPESLSLRTELIRVISICLFWMRDLDRRIPAGSHIRPSERPTQ